MQVKLIALVAPFYMLLLTPFAWAQRAGSSVTGEVHGQVRYAVGGAPAERVLVRLDVYSGGTVGQVLTDRNGTFRFPRLEPLQYTITIHAPGYKEVQQQVNLKTSTSEYLLLQLTPDPNARTQPTDKAPASGVPSIVDATIPPEAQKEFAEGKSALLEAKRVDEGRKHLEKAISLYPDFLEAQLLLGTAFMEGHDWRKAEAALRRALEINDKTSQGYFALGEVYRQQNRNQEAEKALQAGLKLDDNAWQGHFTLGRVYLALNDIGKAGMEAGRALQLKPDFAEAYVLAGNILLRAKKGAEALPMFEEYLRLAPKGGLANETRDLVEKIKKALADKK
jgi:Tfp pilus assembly protein PilF